MLIIGSKALEGTELEIRKPKDVDVIMPWPEYQHWSAEHGSKMRVLRPLNDRTWLAINSEGVHIEIEIAWEGTAAHSLHSKLSMETMKLRVLPELGLGGIVAPLNVLLALKLSHRYLKDSPHFLKTMRDIQYLRRFTSLNEYLKAWLPIREKETYVYKHPNLSQDKASFFSGDGVIYHYDHDSIHVAVARLPGQPAYSFYLKDGEQVKVDRRKWDALPEEYRLNGVVEEATVLALERSQIPFRGKVDPRKSFEYALMKVCTSITSGWFREYAWEHYDAVLAMYDPEYVNKFWAAVDAGIVKPYTGSKY